MMQVYLDAQHAIQQERERRGYQVVVASPRVAYGIAGVPMPEALSAYVAFTLCTVHSPPCLWVDWAFALPDDHVRVVLQSDLLRPGMLVEESVKALFAELEAEEMAARRGN